MLAKEPSQRWTLEQCVTSAAFSDELLVKLRKACPELAPHLEHFMVSHTPAWLAAPRLPGCLAVPRLVAAPRLPGCLAAPRLVAAPRLPACLAVPRLGWLPGEHVRSTQITKSCTAGADDACHVGVMRLSLPAVVSTRDRISTWSAPCHHTARPQAGTPHCC